MDPLLVDISNSFTKFATGYGATLTSPVRRMPTASLADGRAPELAAAGDGRALIACSVVPGATAALRRLRDGRTEPVVFLDGATDSGLRIDYPDPLSIGPDRLANALAATELLPVPCVVVDFGTAVTFDILDRRAAYVGGIIAPGLDAMTRHMHTRTALLPEIDPREPDHGFIGKSTEEAMLIGTVYGYRGMIRGLIDGLRRDLASDRPLTVAATGGYADLIAAGLPEIDRVIDHLTLIGLGVLAGRLGGTAI